LKDPGRGAQAEEAKAIGRNKISDTCDKIAFHRAGKVPGRGGDGGGGGARGSGFRQPEGHDQNKPDPSHKTHPRGSPFSGRFVPQQCC